MNSKQEFDIMRIHAMGRSLAAEAKEVISVCPHRFGPWEWHPEDAESALSLSDREAIQSIGSTDFRDFVWHWATYTRLMVQACEVCCEETILYAIRLRFVTDPEVVRQGETEMEGTFDDTIRLHGWRDTPEFRTFYAEAVADLMRGKQDAWEGWRVVTFDSDMAPDDRWGNHGIEEA